MLSVGSLFSGIGGFDLGLERAGMRVLWQCESDPFCQRVLARHWPEVPCHPDVSELRGADVEPVDVLCGGFPCQDISGAGKRVGIGGSRSGLWSEYARLIGELRPRYVVVENVADLLVRGMGVVLGDLAALGYDAEWDCIPASAFGAPHQRDRVWIVAYPQCDGNRTEVVRRETDGSHTAGPSSGPSGSGHGSGAASDSRGQRFVADASGKRGPVGREPGDVAGASRPRQRAREERQRDGDAADDRGADVADAARQRGRQRRVDDVQAHPVAEGGEARPVSPGGGLREGGCGWPTAWAPEPDVGRVVDGFPAQMDRLRSLGNALVPQIAEWLGRRILEWEEASPPQVCC